MLDEQTAADIAAQWVGATCDIPAERRFAYPQATKEAELPDVAAAVASSEVTANPPREHFPMLALDNTWATVYVVEFSIMVEQGDDESEAAAAQASVYGYAKALREALFADLALGERLDNTAGQWASPLIAFDFSEPFVEYEDGTTGRVTPGTLRIAEAIAEPG